MPRLDGGGVEQATLDTAAAVARAGGRALVASHGGEMESDFEASGAELIRLPVHSRNPLVQALNIGRLADVMRRERVSVAHVRSRAPAFSAIPAARSARRPVITTYHGIYQARGAIKRWYNGVMTRGDLTVANSEFTGDHVMAQHHLDPARLVVVPEGVDTCRFDPAAVSPARMAAVRHAWGLRDSAETLILLAARLTGWKGQGVMIQALARLQNRPDIRLVLAGREQKPGEIDALRDLAAGADLQDRVTFAGPTADMPAAYAAVDLVVAPSTLPESFGRGVVEAGAMERPVLASPLGGPAETVSHGLTGWLVAAGDPEAWAQAVLTALALPDKARQTMGRAARKHILANYSLAATNAAMFEVYRRVLDTPR